MEGASFWLLSKGTDSWVEKFIGTDWTEVALVAVSARNAAGDGLEGDWKGFSSEKTFSGNGVVDGAGLFLVDSLAGVAESDRMVTSSSSVFSVCLDFPRLDWGDLV